MSPLSTPEVGTRTGLVRADGAFISRFEKRSIPPSGAHFAKYTKSSQTAYTPPKAPSIPHTPSKRICPPHPARRQAFGSRLSQVDYGLSVHLPEGTSSVQCEDRVGVLGYLAPEVRQA